MVRSIQHAVAISKRRVEAGKSGVAHAVRRFFKRVGRAIPSDLPVLASRTARPHARITELRGADLSASK